MMSRIESGAAAGSIVFESERRLHCRFDPAV
jgi:hypothetical protein